MDETCAAFDPSDFDRFGPLVLVLYGDVIIFAKNPKQLMNWCLKILSHKVDIKEVGVSQVANGLRLCFSYSQMAKPLA